jgi:Sulfotransferase domain
MRMPQPAAANPPILVTGMPRSGTTWVATMLAATRRVVYVNEPLNPQHPPGGSPGILNVRVTDRFQYITDANGDAYADAYAHLLALRFGLAAELRVNRRPADIVRAGHTISRFALGRLTSRRPLIADPFAVLSTRWFARRLGCRVVIVVRRPEAVVSSRKRLGWTFDPGVLRSQTLLDAEVLEPLEREHPALFEPHDDLIGQGAQLWAILHLAIARIQREVPDVLVVRHEDLSRDPIAGFRALAEWLALPFEPRLEHAVRRATSSANPSELDAGDPHRTRLNSIANLDNWRGRLTVDEIERVRTLTAPAAGVFYPDFGELAAPTAAE